jgi:excinuclease ABC subunit B
MEKLISGHYGRNDISFERGVFRVRGDVIDIYPAYLENSIRVEFFGDEIERICEVNAITGEVVNILQHAAIFPASHYTTTRAKMERAIVTIEEELDERLAELREQDRIVEAYRLEQRTRYDLEMLREIGFCQGIENYSRHISGRAPGSPPHTLIDSFPKDYLMIIDESHVSVPQVGAMYRGDRSRKESLVEYGFRLQSAFDNRPLKFEEFERKCNQVIFVSATPSVYEKLNSIQVVEQIIRPTGLLDPEVEVRPVEGQIDNLVGEINERVERKERTLITTLTKRMAESLTDYFTQLDIKVKYLHSDIETLQRTEIIRDLRLGVFDVLVGINLLREGIDLPEVSLVAILDADKEGFLRHETSLVQTIGRAARNENGKVIMYADKVTESMRRAISETNRRREIQQAFNREHNIEPKSIQKGIRDAIEVTKVAEKGGSYRVGRGSASDVDGLGDIGVEGLMRMIEKLTGEMKAAAKNLEFERAAGLRDAIQEMKNRLIEFEQIEKVIDA